MRREREDDVEHAGMPSRERTKCRIAEWDKGNVRAGYVGVVDLGHELHLDGREGILLRYHDVLIDREL